MVESILTLGERLIGVLEYLGLPTVHVCLRAAGDLSGLGAQAPDRIASVVVSGVWGPPSGLIPFLDRTLWVQGDGSTQARTTVERLAALAGARIYPLASYPDDVWSDTAADRTEELAEVMLAFLSERAQAVGLQPVSCSLEGEVGGVTFRAAGTGTLVVLLPLGLAAQQWEPLLPRLQAHHCTIVLGGRYLAPLSFLEARAAGDYSRMALGALDLALPSAEESVVEVGCGSGALLRHLARRGDIRQITGIDVNPFLLQEAHALATADGLGERLVFLEGSAEAIPLPDNAFDITFSSTLLEEGDTDRMLREMVRVTKPNGRVVAVVRSIDLPWRTNLPLPKGLATKALSPLFDSVTENGCADGSLARRLHNAGLGHVRGGPDWSWVGPSEPFWPTREALLFGRLTQEEIETWRSVQADVETRGLPVSVAQPYHCAFGVKEVAPRQSQSDSAQRL
jgi:SAM-dependent methyltransferase